ncbi:MAG: hypothetical protein IKS01_01030 [Paludibacteraceae bacterium]|nr:hypothetical protein [Paludibacteraceae bacterium]
MKNIALLILAAALLGSCGMMNNSAASSSSAATSSTSQSLNPSQAGSQAGSALAAIYKQYKAEGTYNVKNPTNIANLMLLLSNCKDLTTEYKNKDYLTSFGTGLIAGSAGLVVEQNAAQVTDYLYQAASTAAQTVGQGTRTGTEQAESTISKIGNGLQTASQTAGTISSLMSLFGAAK